MAGLSMMFNAQHIDMGLREAELGPFLIASKDRRAYLCGTSTGRQPELRYPFEVVLQSQREPFGHVEIPDLVRATRLQCGCSQTGQRSEYRTVLGVAEPLNAARSEGRCRREALAAEP